MALSLALPSTSRLALLSATATTWFSALLPAAATTILSPGTTRARSPLQALLELFPPFLLAVPKKKVSHSRKAMRSANKGLKDKQNIVHCPACGSPKLAHHLCANCYTFLNRQWKSQSKQADGGSIPDLS